MVVLPHRSPIRQVPFRGKRTDEKKRKGRRGIKNSGEKNTLVSDEGGGFLKAILGFAAQKNRRGSFS